MLSWGGGKPPPQTSPLHKTTDFDGKNNPGGLLHTTRTMYCGKLQIILKLELLLEICS